MGLLKITNVDGEAILIVLLKNQVKKQVESEPEYKLIDSDSFMVELRAKLEDSVELKTLIRKAINEISMDHESVEEEGEPK
jgi:hypothetical protein